MFNRRLVSVALAFALLATACGGGQQEITIDNCGDVVDETLELLQRLVDDVDTEFSHGEMTVEAFIANEGNLPSVDRFTKDAEKIDKIGKDLGCTQSEIQQSMLERIDELTASTDLGRFLITAIRTGGL